MQRTMVFSFGILAVCYLAFFNVAYGQNTCDALIDLTLIIDSSGSIAPEDFQRGKGALIDLVSRLNVGVDKAGVALINYASNVTLSAVNNVFMFEQQQLMTEIAALPHLATNTATGDALGLAKVYCESQCRELGLGVPRIFAIITDGHSNVGQPVLPAAAAIREAPIEGTIFAVGIGNIGPDGDQELLDITGDIDYVMHIDSYLDLARVTNAISMKMCNIPAFVLPDRLVFGEVADNNTRYFRMKPLNRMGKNVFFEINLETKVGKTTVFTSTTNKNPNGYSSRTATADVTATKKTYTTYVPGDTKNFYFSVKGGAPGLNKFNFTVRIRPLN